MNPRGDQKARRKPKRLLKAEAEEATAQTWRDRSRIKLDEAIDLCVAAEVELSHAKALTTEERLRWHP